MNIPMLKALGLQGELLVLGNAYISTVAMVVGAMFNIVFDYLLIWVFHQGMKGAAIASVMDVSH